MPRLDVYRRRRRVPLHDNDEGVVSVRKGGAVFFKGATGTNNDTFVMCLALAAHEIDAVETIYINDVPVTLLCDASFALCQGESPVAVFPTTSVAGNDVIPANTKVRGIVRAGNKLAAITGTGTGTLYITVDG